MKQKFKFRHADEIAGTFVICAVVLFVVAVVLAGRSQGWFDGSFKLKVVFDSADGSFGLQEGAVVQVRSAVAGRVGKIAPTEDGVMATTLILKERFRPFISKTSVAKVKKKFGVAGDSYVEIERGSGGVPIEDEDTIACVKDEELMDSAQKMLAEFQEQMTPLLEKVEQITTSTADILESIDKGEGIAGAVVSDTKLRDDLTQIVSHMEGIADDAEATVTQIGSLMSNDVNSIVGDVTVMSSSVRKMMTNEIPEIVAGIPDMQDEILSTITESRRLIEGIQRHWLFRKYIEYDSESVPLVPVGAGIAGNRALQRKLEKTLAASRGADDMAAVSRDAYNLAVFNLAAGKADKAAELNTEARIACRSAGKSEASTYLLQAELSRLVRDFDAAAELVNRAVALIDKKDKETRLEAAVMSAAINLDAGNIAAAATDLKSAEKLNKKQESPLYSAAISGLRGGIALREGRHKEAAVLFAAQADYLRKTGDFDSMADALRQTADIYSNLEMHSSAAEYYYRTASSLAARDMQKQAAANLDLAERSAKAAGDELLLNRILKMHQDN